jgi:hypothetical protein
MFVFEIILSKKNTLRVQNSEGIFIYRHNDLYKLEFLLFRLHRQ